MESISFGRANYRVQVAFYDIVGAPPVGEDPFVPVWISLVFNHDGTAWKVMGLSLSDSDDAVRRVRGECRTLSFDSGRLVEAPEWARRFAAAELPREEG